MKPVGRWLRVILKHPSLWVPNRPCREVACGLHCNPSHPKRCFSTRNKRGCVEVKLTRPGETRTSPPGHGAPKPFQSSRNSSGDPSHHANFESDHHHACVHDRSLPISIRVISIRSARSIPGELYPSLVNAGDVQEILLPSITSI